jgi:hypothetical protein
LHIIDAEARADILLAMKHTANAVKLAGAVALAGSSQAYGQIIPLATLPTDITSSFGNGNTIEYYNVLTGASTPNFISGDNFRFEVSSGLYYGSTFFNSAVIPLQLTDAVAVPNSGAYNASAISAGTKIGSDTYSFSQGTNFTPGVAGSGPENKIYLVNSYPPAVFSNQQPNTPTYLGFQFADALGNVHDGYLEVDTTYDMSSGNDTLEFLGGAYNSATDNGTGSGDITTAPEPGTLASLVLGAAALGAVGLMRRRRSFLAQN